VTKFVVSPLVLMRKGRLKLRNWIRPEALAAATPASRKREVLFEERQDDGLTVRLFTATTWKSLFGRGSWPSVYFLVSSQEALQSVRSNPTLVHPQSMGSQESPFQQANPTSIQDSSPDRSGI
jgi:hypothetical protein